jgi:hypothetical protein
MDRLLNFQVLESTPLLLLPLNVTPNTVLEELPRKIAKVMTLLPDSTTCQSGKSQLGL